MTLNCICIVFENKFSFVHNYFASSFAHAQVQTSATYMLQAYRTSTILDGTHRPQRN